MQEKFVGVYCNDLEVSCPRRRYQLKVAQATAPVNRMDLPEYEIQSIGAPTEASKGMPHLSLRLSSVFTCWQGLRQVNVFVMEWRAWY